MTNAQLIQYLRLSVNVQTPDGTEDSAYLSMTDEDLLLYLNVVMTRDFSDYPSLDHLPSNAIYPLILLAKKELYYALAVISAPQYDLGADNNNYLKRDQRFKHYMALIEQADGEYSDWLENGGGLSEDGAGSNTLSSYDVLLNTRYYTKRYYDKGVVPAPILLAEDVTEDTITLSWTNRKVRKFAWCNLYIAEKPLVDLAQLGTSKITDRSTLVLHTTDSRQNNFRIEGLTPDTDYYVAIELVDMSSLTGYAELEVHTESV